MSQRAETIHALLNHDFYTYHLNLRFKWSPAGVDILPRLRGTKTYIVDNNISWKQLAAVHPDVNFVLGCTVSEEAENLDGVLFSKLPPNGYLNVYSLDLFPNIDTIVFNRVDANYRNAVFERSIPTLSNTTPEYRADQVLASVALRSEICQSLCRNPEDLKRELESSLPNCLGSYEQAYHAAVMCTALYFHSISLTLRKNKLDPNYIQLPGDTRLIAEALLFGFSILSNDQRDVHAMGKISGISVLKETDIQA
jgi:hypothetical protein